jgi:serine/threonine protein kinase/tetratricopeptide (TPR) repeat protein
MTDAQPDVLAIFSESLTRKSDVDRLKYLDEACRGDSQIREKVERLLRAHYEAGNFLGGQPPAVVATSDHPHLAQPGVRIGCYKLVEQIGEGGMGVVYLAAQHEPIRRKVALKIIKPGMDTREVVARFNAERQALALMDHPNIAKVLDAGATETGRPYFVMELVRGKPITEYCDERQLCTRERLELFVALCHGVQHAHQKGVIHRDLKPSNLLVELHDVRPVPKIIDFGIAKAIGQQLTEQSLYTGFDQMVGTPLYMSPEQAGQSALDVDTRSDIYALGVVLYELLTGHTPFEKEVLRTAGVDEMRRMIREVDPPRPSARVSTLQAADLSTVSERRHVEPGKLSQQLRGELDWIVMKALDKDRSRRYASAHDLAADIERYLHDEPVLACPPSKRYRLGKFARRNRNALISVCAVLLSFVATLVAVTLSSMSRRELADRRREIADRRSRAHQRINEALTEVVRLRDATSTLKGDDDSALIAAREHLQLATGFLESGFLEPDLLAQVRALKGELDQEQANRAQTRRDREVLAAIEQAWLLKANVDVSESRFTSEDCASHLRNALREYGVAIPDASPAEVAAFTASRPANVRQQLLAAMEELSSLVRPTIGFSMRTADDTTVITAIVTDSPAARDGRLREGDQLVGVGEGQEGEMISTRSLALPEVGKLLSGESGTIVRLEVVPAGETVSRVYEIQRDPTRAWLKRVVELADQDPWRRRLREASQLDDPEEQRQALEDLADRVDVRSQPVRVLTQLAEHLVAFDAGGRATALLRRVREAYPSDLWVNTDLAKLLKDSRPPNLDEAIRFYTAAVALRPDSPGLRLNLGNALGQQGKLEEANDEYRASLRIAPHYAAPRCNLVDNLIALGKDEEAESVALEAVRLFPESAAAHANLARALRKLGKTHEADTAFREAVRLDPSLQSAHRQAAINLFAKGRHEESLEAFREILRLDPTSADSHYNLGLALDLLGREDEAFEAYRACLELNPGFVAALTNLTIGLRRKERFEEAVAACRSVLERIPDSSETYHNLAICLKAGGRPAEAIAAYRECIRLYPHPANFLGYSNLARALVSLPNPSVQDVEEAIALASKAVKFAPRDELALSALGQAYFHHQDWGASIAAFEESESYVDTRKYGVEYIHDPLNLADNYLYRAIAYQHLGQTHEARAWFIVGERSMRRGDSRSKESLLAEAAQILGVELSEARSEQETIAAYRATLKTHPNGASRHNELARLLANSVDIASRDAEQARQHAVQAMELMKSKQGLSHPDTFQAMDVLSALHAEREEYSEAAKLLLNVLEQKPLDAFTWYRLGLMRLASGDKEGYERGCQDLISRYLAIDDPPIAGWEVSWCCKMSPISGESTQQFVRLARESYAAEPDSNRVRNELACALYRAGSFAESLEHLNALSEDDSLRLWNAVWASMAHARLGNAAEAQKWFDVAVEEAKQASWLDIWGPTEHALLRGEAESLLQHAQVEQNETQTTTNDN